ncbi:uncharacterized protein LOC104297273 [Dryobates pubescens]|uniref:uncharacterized protein LOC104297273 n=1 Tax=Dryobates pubescens TaxID=118200 RepID=UPI0023B9888E|nr:uncharacterized protein LOC104297273 [Dryobates pubescens]
MKRPSLSDTIQCLPNSQWSNLPAFCGRSCPSPPRVFFARIKQEDELKNFHPVDTTVSYVCRPGYESTAAQLATSTCLDNLTWSQVPELCYTISCPPPPIIANGHHNGSSLVEFTHNSVVMYTCEPGLQLLGHGTLQCVMENGIDGSWSGSPPECRALGLLAWIILRRKGKKAHSHSTPLEMQEVNGRDPPMHPAVVNAERQLMPCQSPLCYTTSCHVSPMVKQKLHAALAPGDQGCGACEEFVIALPGSLIIYTATSMDDKESWSPTDTSPTCHICPICKVPFHSHLCKEPKTGGWRQRGLFQGAPSATPKLALNLTLPTWKERCSEGQVPSKGEPELRSKEPPKNRPQIPRGCSGTSSPALARPLPAPERAVPRAVPSAALRIAAEREKDQDRHRDREKKGPAPGAAPGKGPTPGEELRPGPGKGLAPRPGEGMRPGATPGKAQTAGGGLAMALRWLCVGLLLPGAGGDCQQPPRFVFAEPPLPLQPSYAVGARLRYRCRPGYTVDKDKLPLVTCDTNSTWAAQPDFCIGRSCGPPELPNGNFDFTTNLLFGSTITYTCNYGYRLVGKPTATCVLQGSQVSWDNLPYCTIIPCLPPPKTENGQVTDGDRDFTFGMTATYSCDKGFALIGEATIHCTMDENLEGVWSGPAPECRVVSCKNPEVPNGMRLSGFGTRHTYKNTVTFGCHPHYLLRGSSVVTCEADSNWNPPLPTCDPIYCGPAPRFPFAELLLAVGESSPAGTVLSYQCKPGYAAARGKSSDVTCLDDTTWSADPDFCTRQHCPAPTIAHGEVNAKEFPFESVVVFTCRPG